MSFEDQLDESPTIASLRSQLHGDRGSFTPAFGGGAGPITVVQNHKLGVVPGPVAAEINHALGLSFTVAVTAKTATQITFKVGASGAVAADPVISWEARV